MEFKSRQYETINCTEIHGTHVEYRTVCGDFPVRAGDGALLGTMFSYSYIRTDVEDNTRRPAVFAFNGGPGSSSMWMHAGLLAPRTVKTEHPLTPPTTPPYELAQNDDCILDVCDLVLIDPMGTGYSLILDRERQNEVYSVEKDAEIFADFIEDWKLRENRMNSPVYLLAESYGTLRACVIPSMLLGGPMTAVNETRGLSVNGIILMGNAVTFQSGGSVFFESNVEKMILNFPTMAACSWYHTEGEKPPLKSYMDEVYAFAGGDLMRALYWGYGLDAGEREAILDRLADFTGLDKRLLRRNNLRIDTGTFIRERLTDSGLDLGLYDGRFTMPQSMQIGSMPNPTADDPAMGFYTPSYRGAFELIARELGIDADQPYTPINFKVNGSWSYASSLSPAEHLQAALRRSPELRVMFCCGYYDLVTTCGQARYLVNHLDCAGSRITVKEYESGHMPYIGESRAQLASDLRTMITGREA